MQYARKRAKLVIYLSNRSAEVKDKLAKNHESSTSDLSAGLADVLKRQRLSLGLNQAQLAERAGLHRSYISEVERGSQNITIETLGRLAEALETSVLTLVEGANKNVRSLTRPIEILLVEDNEADIYILKHSLHNLKVPTNVTVAKDGKEALDILANSTNTESGITPDIILLDLNVPKKSGHEVLSEVKSNPLLKQVPVVILSTSNDKADIEKSYALQANTFITKPVNQKDFQDTIALLVEYWFVVAKVPGT